jgi:hypothetical protein
MEARWFLQMVQYIYCIVVLYALSTGWCVQVCHKMLERVRLDSFDTMVIIAVKVIPLIRQQDENNIKTMLTGPVGVLTRH